MKNRYLSIITILSMAMVVLCSFRSVSSSAVSLSNSFSSSNYKELIIQIPDMNEKNEYEISKALLATGGLQSRGYCPSMHVIMFLYDTSVHTDETFVRNALWQMGFSYDIKTGVTIQQIMEACGSGYVNPNVEVISQQ